MGEGHIDLTIAADRAKGCYCEKHRVFKWAGIMEREPEYAELYSFRERLRLVLMGVALAGVVMLWWSQWALPRWEAFVEQAPCTELWGLSGVAVVYYSLFVGMPLLFALVAAILLGRRGYRILRDRQVPYRGEKVFRPTRIRRGRRAVLIGWAHLLAPALFVALAIWGAPKAQALAEASEAERDGAACAGFMLEQRHGE